MLFNSYVFIFLFLPTTLLGFYLIGGSRYPRIAIVWLVTASLLFYGWWNVYYLRLILASIIFNYAIGVSLSSRPNRGVLVFGVTCNLGLIGYFKYANFFVDNLNALLGSSFVLETILLPLAISFFTFQQIAYLVDAYRGETKEHDFLNYALFVTFFPQLIAGPIVHHKEMLPQFARRLHNQLKANHLAIGISIFVIGLFKKVVLADGIAVHATPVFEAAEAGVNLTLFEAWGGALSYTLQLYFDFSGYSDMAIGLARMFGIRLPLNFNSPYKATSIIDFWRRWHITLSRFLRDYLYIPLGGNRKGPVRRNINILVTMLIGGLWHGAGWTFVIWGGLHGFYLLINHTWRRFFGSAMRSTFGNFIGWLITMFVVIVSWVPFRAESLDGAKLILGAMFGSNGISLPTWMAWKFPSIYSLLVDQGVVFQGMFTNGVFGNHKAGLVIMSILILIAVLLPNTQQMMSRYRPAFDTYHDEIYILRCLRVKWKPLKSWGVIVGIAFLISLVGLSAPSEFLYFQF